MPPALSTSAATYWPAGFRADDQRRPLGNRLEVVDLELDACFARHRQQVQDGIGGAARSCDTRDRVLEGAARADVARLQVALDRVQNDSPAVGRNIVLARIHLRHHRGVHRRQADHLHHRSHRVGRELPAAGARAGARAVLDLLEVFIAHSTRLVRADRFEHFLNRDVLALELAGQDRSAVQNDARNVQPQQRQRRAGNRLVAGHEADESVELVAARHQFDGVGNHLARDQRGLHALGAHGDAVADGDGVELHGSAAGLADARGRRPAPGRAAGSCRAWCRSRCWRCR